MLPILLATLIFAYFIYGLLVLDPRKPVQETLDELTEILQKWRIKATLIKFIKWFSERENQITIGLVAGAGILAWKAWNSSKGTTLYELRGEIIGMAFSVVVIDIVVGYRNWLQEKKRIIQQLSSRSNDFALDAARIIKNEGWHEDGSLISIEIKWAALIDVYLPRAKFNRAHFHLSNLQKAILYRSRFDGAKIVGCNFECASLKFASIIYAEFHNVNFSKADLVNIKAQGVEFHVVNFEGASMKSANLTDAVFLLGSLKNANLTGANLRASNLKTVADIETANLKDALYNAKTIFPDGFDPVAAGAILVEE